MREYGVWYSLYGVFSSMPKHCGSILEDGNILISTCLGNHVARRLSGEVGNTTRLSYAYPCSAGTPLTQMRAMGANASLRIGELRGAAIDSAALPQEQENRISGVEEAQRELQAGVGVMVASRTGRAANRMEGDAETPIPHACTRRETPPFSAASRPTSRPAEFSLI